MKYKDVEAALLKEGFSFVGRFEDHLVFENLARPEDKPRFCTIHIPNPMETISELSVIESFNASQIDIPAWEVCWSD